MVGDSCVAIPERLQEIFTPTIFILRFFGLFPISVHKKGSQLYWKWSPRHICYSVAIAILLSSLTYRGILEDIMVNREKSIKIKTHTDMYVIFCDASVVQLVVFFAVIVNSFLHNDLFGYIRCLNEVDSIVTPLDIKSAKRASLMMIAAIVIATMGISTADIFMYFKTSGERSGKSVIVRCYLPFYFTYLVMLMNQFKFWFIVRTILTRLRVLNELLEIDNLKRSVFDRWDERSKTIFETMPEAKYIGYITDTLNFSPDIKTVMPPIQVKKSSKIPVQNSKDKILRLLMAYIKLCDAVDHLNKVLGVTNAIIIIDILWHLIESPFHLLAELSGPRRDPAYLSMMVTWCCFHFGRLLVLVEPCHACRNEVDKTKTLISKLQCSKEINTQYKEQLEISATALNQCKLEFSAGGLTTIDRSLVTALLGTITTYLVILLQYQNS